MPIKRKNGASAPVAGNPYKTAKERLLAFWNVFEKDDDVLVCINADPDALAGAMAIKQLLRYRVRSVVITHPNEIRRLNNIAMVQRLKIPLEKWSNIKFDAFKKKVMVDSQPPHLPVFEKMKFDVVIDHHPLVGVECQATFADIRPDYGAASSMLVEYLRAAGIKPTVATATALFYGIKVDTRNFEKQSRLSDGISFRYLFTLANRDLVRRIELTDLRRSELKYFLAGLSELKYSKRRFYSHVGKVRSPDVLVIIADFLNHVDEVDWVFVSGIHGERLIVIFRCDGYRKNAGKLAARIFGTMGSAGGHKEAARAEVPLKNLPPETQDFTSLCLKRLTTRHLK